MWGNLRVTETPQDDTQEVTDHMLHFKSLNTEVFRQVRNGPES